MSCRTKREGRLPGSIWIRPARRVGSGPAMPESNGRSRWRQELVPASMRDPSAILAHMSPRFEETFRAVTSVTTDMRIDERLIATRCRSGAKASSRSWGTRRIRCCWHTGQGAAQAMVDAVALGQALGENGSAEDALRSYERGRRRKTATRPAGGTPDGSHHGDDEPLGLLGTGSRRAAGARQTTREDAWGHQSTPPAPTSAGNIGRRL